MLTITQDWEVHGTRLVEVARCEDEEVTACDRATCRLAARLIGRGFGSGDSVRLLRADPYLFAGPHRVTGVTLGLVSQIDFFALAGPAMRDEVLKVLGVTGLDP